MTGNGSWQFALLQDYCTLLSISFALFGESYQVVILELTEPCLVNELLSFINQNVSVPILASSLSSEHLLHFRVILELLDLVFKLGIITTESLSWNVFAIKLSNFSIIELEPIIQVGRVLFAFFYETIVVTTVGCTLVNHNPSQRVLKVLV